MSFEHIIDLEPLGKGLLGTTLRYDYEVRDENDYFSDVPTPRVSKDMVNLAAHILATKETKRYNVVRYRRWDPRVGQAWGGGMSWAYGATVLQQASAMVTISPPLVMSTARANMVVMLVMVRRAPPPCKRAARVALAAAGSKA